MPKFFCDYCGVHLTHDSFFGRKQHMYGLGHRRQVMAHYMKLANEAEAQGLLPPGGMPPPGMMMMVRLVVPARPPLPPGACLSVCVRTVHVVLLLCLPTVSCVRAFVV